MILPVLRRNGDAHTNDGRSHGRNLVRLADDHVGGRAGLGGLGGGAARRGEAGRGRCARCSLKQMECIVYIMYTVQCTPLS